MSTYLRRAGLPPTTVRTPWIVEAFSQQLIARIALALNIFRALFPESQGSPRLGRNDGRRPKCWPLAFLILVTSNASAQTSSGTQSDIYSYRAADISVLREGLLNPRREFGPWVYWFWFDNVVSRREITRELEEMASAGIAGVELRCVSMYGFSGGSPGTWFNPGGWERLGHKRYQYLSPEFVDILEHTLAEAERLGLRFAINLGMGWPPGGRWITEEHRSRHLVSSAKIVQGPTLLEEDSALNVPPNAEVAAWRLRDDRNVIPDSFTELNEHVRSRGSLHWKVPEGRWLIGVFATVPGGVCDKGEGPEADPASRDAILAHLNEMFRRFEPKLGRFFGSTLVDVASDSWEYHRRQGGRYWSPTLFKMAHGAGVDDLKSIMFALLGYGPDRQDILNAIADVERKAIQKHYFETIAEFLRARRLRHRPQVYGRGLERDFFVAYATADIPEIEEGVYVPEAIWCARVLGKPIVSCEAFTHVSIRHGNLRHDAHRGAFSAETDPKRMWQTTPALLRALSNAHFARGINRIQMHSFSYSPPGVPEPGWRMYAEIHLNRNAAWWPELKQFSTWIARNQMVLQSGTPVTDALVYPVKSNPIDGPFNVAPDQPWSAINAVDAANPYVLAKLAAGQGEVPYDCSRIVLRDNIRALEEARHLLTLADRGMTIWCCHTMPHRWQALQDTDRGEVVRLRNAFDRAVRQGSVKNVCHENWHDVVEAHRSVRWTGSGRLSFQRRRISDAEVYLLTSWEERFEGEVSFPHDDLIPEIWDADTGKTRAPEGYTVRNGRTSIFFKLDENESRIVVFSTSN